MRHEMQLFSKGCNGERTLLSNNGRYFFENPGRHLHKTLKLITLITALIKTKNHSVVLANVMLLMHEIDNYSGCKVHIVVQGNLDLLPSGMPMFGITDVVVQMHIH